MTKASQLRLGLFVTVAVLACVNSQAWYGDGAARWIAAALQFCLGVGALTCAVWVARRATGAQRWWRVLVIGALSSWLAGELLWWFGGNGNGAPVAGVVAYFMAALLVLGALVVLARSGGGLQRRHDRPLSQTRVVTVLDGLLAALAFSILSFIAGLGAVLSLIHI